MSQLNGYDLTMPPALKYWQPGEGNQAVDAPGATALCSGHGPYSDSVWFQSRSDAKIKARGLAHFVQAL